MQLEANSSSAKLQAPGSHRLMLTTLRYLPIVLYFVIIATFSVMAPQFLTVHNVMGILTQSTVVGVAALGLSLVIIGGGSNIVQGGIDLSVGATLSLASAVGATVLSLGQPLIIAILAALAVGAFIGSLNALAVVVVGVLPILSTLATSYLANGIELLMTKSRYVPVQDPTLKWVASGTIGPVPVIVVCLFLAFGLFYWIGTKTKFGRHMEACGGNRIAAWISGVKVSRVLAATYVLSGILGGLAGILQVSRLSGSSPLIGNLMLMDIILAAMISSMFSRHLVPNVPGTLLGALLVAILTNGFALINVPTYWVYVCKGLLILGAVALTTRGRQAIIGND